MKSEYNPENEFYIMEFLLENIKFASEGVEPSDFALSFGIVRDVWDLYVSMKTLEDTIKK